MSNTALSENEDDPEVYESSGEDWDNVEEKKGNIRTSQRLSKRPRKKVVETESSEEEEEDEEEDPSDEELSDEEPKKKKAKNGVKKRTPQKSNKREKDEDSSDGKDNSNQNIATVPIGKGIHRKFVPKTIYSEDYATGSFVILKKDAQAGDPSKHPCIWRIDGKALLQKYEAFDEEGKVKHKNTSIYTGWSPMDKDLYAPVTVDVIYHNNQNLTVELHWDKLKDIVVDSD